MRVALVHYWIVSMRGGERVLEALAEMYPDADIYTHVVNPDGLSSVLAARDIRTTFISRLPFALKLYQAYLPLMPLALEALDLTEYDLVISSEAGPAKGLILSPEATHVCYCHSPMRYVWDMYFEYRKGASWPVRIVMPLVAHYLRRWDTVSAMRVDRFVANSRFSARRIEQRYRRPATVVPPPVDTSRFVPGGEREDFFLYVGQLLRYKRADLAISAFNESGRRLVVVGEGEERARLEAMAGPNIEFRGRASLEELQSLYSRARALVFPGVEDFGIVPVEAMAAGLPVIAFRRGGALETVVEGETGIFFDERSPEALNGAVAEFLEREGQFRPERLREHARSFRKEEFQRRMAMVVKEAMESTGELGPSGGGLRLEGERRGR